jgi:tetratricopeptide (TPR) repeat protein
MNKNPGKTHPRPAAGNTTFFRPNALAVLLMAITAIIIYSNTFKNPFVFDDINFITQNNPHLHMTRLSWAQIKEALFEAQPGHRFLPKISFALNYYFGGENPRGFHLVNLLIHILTGVFLFIFIQTTVRLSDAACQRAHTLREDSPKNDSSAALIAFSAAMIWMVHPIQTNAVTYMCQRMTSMVAMFYILSLLTYARGRIAWRLHHHKQAAAYWTGCIIAGACAVASKENAGMLPVFILVYEWYFFQDLRNIRTYRSLTWLIAGMILFAAVALWYLGQNPFQRILASYANRDFDLSQRVMTEWRVVAYYFSLTAFPYPGRFHLDHDYPLSYSLLHPTPTIASLGMIAALFAAGIYLAKNHRLFSFCILWCLGNLVIESSVIGIEIIFEHRMYLPSMMVCLMATLPVFRVARSPWAAFWALAALAALLSAGSYQRNAVWKSDVSFWMDNAEKSPNKARPYQNLAFSYQIQRDFKNAIVNYRKSIRIKPHPVAYFNLGLALKEESEPLEAVDAFVNALKLGYSTPQIHANLAQTLAFIGEFEDAAMHFKQAIAMNPQDATPRKNYEKLQEFIKTCGNPVECVRILATQQPDNLALSYKLGALNERQGNLEEAKTAYERVLARLDPNAGQKLYLLTLNRLAGIDSARGDTNRALELFKTGVRMKPDDPHFYYQTAAVYAGQNDEVLATQWLEEAVRRGFADWEQIKKDNRWAKIRNTANFQRLKNRTPASREPG